MPAGARLVSADRSIRGAYQGLGEFDAAIEVSWQPSFVADALRQVRADHWVYVSSISAYSHTARAAQGTSGRLLPAWSGSGAATREVYGEAKVACERSFERSLPTSAYVIARAGLIAGYGDPTDRFGYWPARIAQAEGDRRRVLVPAPLSSPVQAIDVLDLATWLLHCAESRVSGCFDAVGRPSTLREVLDACAAVAGTSPELVPLDGEQLARFGARPWMGRESLPLWAPGLGDLTPRSATAARAAGLLLGPLPRTISDALRWERELGLSRERTSGLSASLEAQILQHV